MTLTLTTSSTGLQLVNPSNPVVLDPNIQIITDLPTLYNTVVNFTGAIKWAILYRSLQILRSMAIWTYFLLALPKL